MRYQESADRQSVVCVVLSSHKAEHGNFRIPRTRKRITLIASITLDGSFLRPTVIIPRKTVDSDLVLTGMTSEKVTIQFAATLLRQYSNFRFLDRRNFSSRTPKMPRGLSVRGTRWPHVR
jgi:hypothetical protein